MFRRANFADKKNIFSTLTNYQTFFMPTRCTFSRTRFSGSQALFSEPLSAHFVGYQNKPNYTTFGQSPVKNKIYFSTTQPHTKKNGNDSRSKWTAKKIALGLTATGILSGATYSLLSKKSDDKPSSAKLFNYQTQALKEIDRKLISQLNTYQKNNLDKLLNTFTPKQLFEAKKWLTDDQAYQFYIENKNDISSSIQTHSYDCLQSQEFISIFEIARQHNLTYKMAEVVYHKFSLNDLESLPMSNSAKWEFLVLLKKQYSITMNIQQLKSLYSTGFLGYCYMPLVYLIKNHHYTINSAINALQNLDESQLLAITKSKGLLKLRDAIELNAEKYQIDAFIHLVERGATPADAFAKVKVFKDLTDIQYQGICRGLAPKEVSGLKTPEQIEAMIKFKDYGLQANDFRDHRWFSALSLRALEAVVARGVSPSEALPTLKHLNDHQLQGVCDGLKPEDVIELSPIHINALVKHSIHGLKASAIKSCTWFNGEFHLFALAQLIDFGATPAEALQIIKNYRLPLDQRPLADCFISELQSGNLLGLSTVQAQVWSNLAKKGINIPLNHMRNQHGIITKSQFIDSLDYLIREKKMIFSEALAKMNTSSMSEIIEIYRLSKGLNKNDVKDLPITQIELLAHYKKYNSNFNISNKMLNNSYCLDLYIQGYNTTEHPKDQRTNLDALTWASSIDKIPKMTNDAMLSRIKLQLTELLNTEITEPKPSSHYNVRLEHNRDCLKFKIKGITTPNMESPTTIDKCKLSMCSFFKTDLVEKNADAKYEKYTRLLLSEGLVASTDGHEITITGPLNMLTLHLNRIMPKVRCDRKKDSIIDKTIKKLSLS